VAIVKRNILPRQARDKHRQEKLRGKVLSYRCALDMIAAAVENTTGAGNFYAVRDIAAAVAKEFPHVMIETLAYNGAQQPPSKLKFADNIIVRIAGFNMGSGNQTSFLQYHFILKTEHLPSQPRTNI